MNLVQTERHSLSMLCSLLGYSRQAFYKSLKSHEEEGFRYELVLQQVGRIRVEQPRIGCRKRHHLLLEEFLKEHDMVIGRDALFSLLRDYGLLVRKRRRRAITTLSRHWLHKYSNLIRDFTPLKWVSDITYIHVGDGFAYLSLITDAYSRFVVGYSLSDNLSAKGCMEALRMAISCQQVCDGLIHHSDRGVQYCSFEYVGLLSSVGIGISMTENGDPLENAIAERMNGILKMELLEEVYPSLEKARADVAKAIHTYNNKRPHSSLC